MTKRIPLFLAAITACLFSFADCGDRYATRVFDSVLVTKKIQFGSNKTSSGRMQKLFMDIYEPYGDTEPERPIIALAHGGAFINLIDQTSPDIVLLATDLAKRGYVVASFDYREEENPVSLLFEDRMVKAVIRSVQDGKAAIGFLKNNGIGENTWRIDPDQMILGGVSAGAILADHLVYVKDTNQLTAEWQRWVNRIGGLQGTTGPAGYDQKLLGLIRISGALGNSSWVATDPVPAMSIHGHLDPIVPYMAGKPLGIPTLPDMYGSYYVQRVADSLDFSHILYDYPDRGHVPFMNITDLSDLDFSEGIDGLFNQPILDTTYEYIARFCYSLLECNNTPTPVTENKIIASPLIYPNPGNGGFSIEWPAAEAVEIQLVNTAGQIIYSKFFKGKLQVRKEEWAAIPGVYLALVRTPQNGKIIGRARIVVD